MMKNIYITRLFSCILILLFFIFIGCNNEPTLQENSAKHNWTLDYFSKVTINGQELYNCVYAGPSRAFTILNNEKCKDRL